MRGDAAWRGPNVGNLQLQLCKGGHCESEKRSDAGSPPPYKTWLRGVRSNSRAAHEIWVVGRRLVA